MRAQGSAENGLLTDAERDALSDWQAPGNRLEAVVEQIVRERMAQAWDERDKARPQYLGPEDGHYPDCVGWGDCYCGTYPNPYRVTSPGEPR